MTEGWAMFILGICVGVLLTLLIGEIVERQSK